ncbi:MAG: hypothetical protein LBE92_10605 [Chryseobacterium sp.]|jgi:hypothetical protein|uniref:hypothetical protein n=1 Tax=Chryseobacterium sp. TaxID=1871047 RepID=UPI00282272B2|nr:hypothetical protein [Chryseobacterium sp.]MDR2236566.1 hypothetical protein [Chryseobacterium sp.]
MKKISLALSIIAGTFVFAQSSSFIIQNYSAYDVVGRLRTAPAGGAAGPYMYAAPNPPYGSYTIPAGGFTQYNSFSTSGTATFPIVKWYVTDYTNPANNGSYAYNHPFISTVMDSVNEWAGFHFWLNDPITGVTDIYSLGDPSIDPAFNSSMTGSISSADWFTITTPSGPTTYLQVY